MTSRDATGLEEGGWGVQNFQEKVATSVQLRSLKPSKPSPSPAASGWFHLAAGEISWLEPVTMAAEPANQPGIQP